MSARLIEHKAAARKKARAFGPAGQVELSEKDRRALEELGYAGAEDD